MVKRFARSDPLFTFGHHSATRQGRQPLSEFVFNWFVSFGMVPCDGGQTLRGKLFHTDGTDTEQRKRADYFNVKELPNLSG